MKTVLLIGILCFQQYCFLGAVNAVLGLNFGDNCTDSTECQLKNLTCLENICQCESGFYFKLKSSCLSPENCTSADDCLSSNSSCINGICDCTPGLYPDLTICLPQHDMFDFCNETAECLGDNVQCKENNCTCKDKYYYQNGSCYEKKDIFDFCNETAECLGDNVQCKENNCTCKDKYYYWNGSCYEKRILFEYCTDARQCVIENSQCKMNECNCKDNYYDLNGYCHEKHKLSEPCNKTKQCLGENTQCEQGSCICEDKYYRQNNSCFEKHKLFESCTDARECFGKNMQCEKNKCNCKDNYFDLNGSCHKKHGLFHSCTDTKECLGKYVECEKRNCSCAHETYYKNGSCHLKRRPTSDCQFNSMCQVLSHCINKKCTCIDGHYLDKFTCFLKVKYKEPCFSNDGCSGENMVCSSQKCNCKDDYEYKDSMCKKKRSSTLIIIIVILIILLLCVLGYILWKIKFEKSGDFNPPPEGTQMKLNIPRHRPILMSNFPEVVNTMHQDNNKIFAQNFLDLDRINPLIYSDNANLTSSKKYLPCHEATKPGNGSKNRFLDILPFDHSRVKLKPMDDDDNSDYINASYISGYSREKEYIAAQGPLPNTSSDFWRMIWQEKVSIIVMLTQCREKEMNKCDNYWPVEKDKKLDFDDITVETTNVTNYDSYDYRTITLKMDEKSHSLKHFHFLHWADFSANVPVDVLIDFVRNVRLHITSNAPVVIHCSAGVGRTGTFIAVDYLLQFVDANPLDSNIDVFHFVSKMRENRVHMVQNKNQYILIHDCIRHAVKKKIALENGEAYDVDDENPYENEGFVTIDLTDKPKDVNTSQESVQILIEKSEEEEKVEEKEENEGENEEKEEKEEEEENPYENEVQVSVHATENEKKNNDEDVDLEENPYENEVIHDREGTAEEENPYENQDFVEADEKQKLTNL